MTFCNSIRGFSKLKSLVAVCIIVTVLIGTGYYAIAISRYSLEVTSRGVPTVNCPREKDGFVFCASFRLQPVSRLPLTFESIEVFDGWTAQKLDIDVLVYDIGSWSLSDRVYIVIGHVERGEWFTHFANRVEKPSNLKIKSQDIWVFPLFEKLPPQDHGARILVKYNLFGIFQKEEEILLDFS